MADEPTDLSKERRRRHPFRPRVVSEHEAALVDEYARAYFLAERATVKRFETALLKVLDLPTLLRVTEAYQLLKNPDAGKVGHGEPVPT
jgi:hypothetical protein